MATHVIRVPDIGGAAQVDVIEILVKQGDSVNAEASLITLESDKASMEVPAPYSGKIAKILVKVGDKVSEGSPIVELITAEEIAAAPASAPKIPAASAKAAAITASVAPATSMPTAEKTAAKAGDNYAGPGARRLARELDLDLSVIPASGRKGRITQEDVQNYVKAKMHNGAGSGLAVAAAPVIDFAKFGAIETVALNKIKQLTGANLHRSWMTVPHVTQFGDADITELEAFRQDNKERIEKQGFKLTPLVFIIKAVIAALRQLPQFNASLDASGKNVIMKKYFHIGVAVDTPNGLVVPVIRDAEQKNLTDLAKILTELSQKARDKKLTPADMSGGCFTISSLGGIGGTAFTPIINHPEVAILGVSKAKLQPVYQGEQFVPRLLLPLSLSYDHRVIDGADGARFIVAVAQALSDIRTLLL